MDLISVAHRLCRDAGKMRFVSPVAHVYNPLDYAWKNHAAYLRRFGRGRKEIVLLGMNPGPWGMVQTGVPFGDIPTVRDWMELREPIRRPKQEHPKRPILGLDCPRTEVSGARLWGWVRDRFATPHRFFRRFFVLNYCPLAFISASGSNMTPDKLLLEARKPLLDICDRALRESVAILQPRFLIGVGNFAEKRASAALTDADVAVGRILHPSPASPAANLDWAARVDDQLRQMGIAALA